MADGPNVLEQLKAKAQSARSEREAEAERQARLKAAYQQSIRPRMLAILDYLTKFTEALDEAGMTLSGSFRFPGLGAADGMAYESYKLRIDSTETPKALTFTFLQRKHESGVFTLEYEPSEELFKFLSSQHVRAVTWPNRSKKGVRRVDVETTLGCTTTFFFLVDMERGAVDVEIHNFQSAEVVTHHFADPAALDDAWLNRLGLYLMGQESSLVDVREVPEEERVRIKQHIQALMEKEEQEERERLRRIEEEEARERAAKHEESTLFSLLEKARDKFSG